MPDPALSAALKEAYASAPVGIVVYHTLEIWSAGMSAPIRVVRDYEPVTAMLESTAPRDASTLVTFAAYAFDLVPPELTTSQVPVCQIEIDNVDRVILAQLDLAILAGSSILILYRQFLSTGLTTGPENLPVLTLTAVSVSATPQKIKLTAGFPDLLNRKFPGQDYDPEIFKGLAR